MKNSCSTVQSGLRYCRVILCRFQLSADCALNRGRNQLSVIKA